MIPAYLTRGLNFTGQETNNPFQSLLSAIERNDLSAVEKCFVKDRLAFEQIKQAIITAQTQKKHDLVKVMIRQLSQPERISLLSDTILTKIDNGNNMALELAKNIEVSNKAEEDLKDAAIATAQKKLSEQSDAIFKENVAKQLKTISGSLLNAITKFQSQTAPSEYANCWTTQPKVMQATVKDQLEVINRSLVNQSGISLTSIGNDNGYVKEICTKLSDKIPVTFHQSVGKDIPNASVDVVIAPHTLQSEMNEIFKATEGLLDPVSPLPIESHPFYRYFCALRSSENSAVIATLPSDLNIQDMTNILLGKYNDVMKDYQAGDLKLKNFNNIETFLRLLEVFKRKFEKQTGKTIETSITFSQPHVPLQAFCDAYVKEFPEIAEEKDLDKFAKLLAVFNVGNDIVDVNYTISMKIKEKSTEKHSFKPVNFQRKKPSYQEKTSSKDLTDGKQTLSQQIQNLPGSEIAMPYIKDADGQAQMAALQSITQFGQANILDVGGGSGEPNAVFKTLQDKGTKVRALNLEPHHPFCEEYNDNLKAVGVDVLPELLQYVQGVTVKDIINRFDGRQVDAILASHSFYFLLEDMMKATQNYIYGDPNASVDPLRNFFDMLLKKRVLVVTLQSGAGARLYRNALLGQHGLNLNTARASDLLKSFGNIATFLRHFELSAKRYVQETDKKINIKMYYGVASVPLGGFSVEKDATSGAYVLHNPNGSDNDAEWLAPEMMNFYGNWSSLKDVAKRTPETIGNNPNTSVLLAEAENARKTQGVFLNILGRFAIANQDMQHPNFTFEITIE